MGLLMMTSCSGFLDHEPDERVDIESGDVEQNVVDLLVTSYPAGNYGWIGEISSDNVIDNNSPHEPAVKDDSKPNKTVHYNLSAYERMDEELFRFEQVESSTSTDSPSFIWENFYASTASVNLALQAIDNYSAKNGGELSTKMKAARAEALLLRAYNHFILVNLFSQAYKNDEASSQDVGIPYITEPEDKVIVNYERGTVTETYNKIEEDLLEGLKEISDVNYEKPKWRFNVNAAHAFAARFYLFKRDYDKVIEHANAVLGTDRTNLSSMLMDYSGFDECTNSVDFANVWQSPDANNNLMLLNTYSLAFRRLLGYRFAVAGKALRDIAMHTFVSWNGWTGCPAFFVSGPFRGSNSDYGLCSAKIAERFEYTNKISGIGYCHVIRREFTATELLLERAEAELLCSAHDVDGCVADLIAYDLSRQTFATDSKNYYTGLTTLTQAQIQSYYSNTDKSNVVADWGFTQNMSSDFIVSNDLIPYMNCINDFRRYETAYDGLRFFDLKRWGMEYSHSYGLEGTEYKLTWNDPRRAIEIPQEVEAAGLETSRTQNSVLPTTGTGSAQRESNLQKMAE